MILNTANHFLCTNYHEKKLKKEYEACVDVGYVRVLW